MADSDRKRPWKAPRSTYAIADEWLRLRTLPTGPVIEHPDWVDVIALTPDLNIVLVDQYRHSVRSVRTEFPAGTVDEGEVIHAYELPLPEFIAKVEAGAIELPALQLAGLWWLRARLTGRGVPGISIPFP